MLFLVFYFFYIIKNYSLFYSKLKHFCRVSSLMWYFNLFDLLTLCQKSYEWFFSTISLSLSLYCPRPPPFWTLLQVLWVYTLSSFSRVSLKSLNNWVGSKIIHSEILTIRLQHSLNLVFAPKTVHWNSSLS